VAGSGVFCDGKVCKYPSVPPPSGWPIAQVAVISTVKSIAQCARDQIQTGQTTYPCTTDVSAGNQPTSSVAWPRGEQPTVPLQSMSTSADAASDPAVVWAAFKAGGGGYDRTASAGGGGYDRTASAGGGGYDVQVATGRTGATASAPR
jgi:hypothetical protein